MVWTHTTLDMAVPWSLTASRVIVRRPSIWQACQESPLATTSTHREVIDLLEGHHHLIRTSWDGVATLPLTQGLTHVWPRVKRTASAWLSSPKRTQGLPRLQWWIQGWILDWQQCTHT